MVQQTLIFSRLEKSGYQTFVFSLVRYPQKKMGLRYKATFFQVAETFSANLKTISKGAD